ncbi:carbohydrate porin [Carnimonas bestiolae]|uniref:carbohydrate porin n=1 Tax=Carnimonas bestiolae TaxID=3402172 RepID=UPI003EDB9EBE
MGKFIVACAGVLCVGCSAVSSNVLAYSAFDPDSEYMFGDWGGERTRLEESGIFFDLDFTGEGARNIGGGDRSSSTTKFADQFGAGVGFDLEKLLGVSGADVYMSITNRNGHNIGSRLNSPDSLVSGSSTQEVEGRGPVTRLTSFWWHQRLFNDALELKLGRIPAGDDFGVIINHFQNLAFGGNQAGNWGNNIYNSPIAQWAAIVRYNFAPEAYFQVGAFNVNDSNLENGHGFNLTTNGSQGTHYPIEVGYTPKINGLQGTYRFGYYYNNADSRSWGARESSTNDSNSGLYYVAQQQVTRQNNDDNRGLTLFSLGNINHGDTAGVDRYISGGLTYKGLFDARPKDDMGIGVAYLHFNNDVNDFVDWSNSQHGTHYLRQGHEIDAEIYYGFQLTNYLSIRPNIQYVVNPSGASSVDDGWVLGSRIEATF